MPLSVSQGIVAAGWVALSPTIRTDQHLLLISHDSAFLSVDLGTAWVPIALPAGQFVTDGILAPGFSTNQTMYLAVVTAIPTTQIGSNRPESIEVSAHETSVGILRSTDAGKTWAGVSDGLQVNGAAYRAVQSLAISPDFEQDHTLLAFASGPQKLVPPAHQVADPTYAPFRSRNGGETWEIVWPARPSDAGEARGSTGTRLFADVAISPSGMATGQVRMRIRSANLGPHSSWVVMASEDFGTTWRYLESEACMPPPRVVGVDQIRAKWHALGGPVAGIAQYSWPGSPPPVWYQQPTIAVAGEDFFFRPTASGVWGFGPELNSTDGRLP